MHSAYEYSTHRVNIGTINMLMQSIAQRNEPVPALTVVVTVTGFAAGQVDWPRSDPVAIKNIEMQKIFFKWNMEKPIYNDDFRFLTGQ